MPLFSIIVPIYKVEPYLHRCLDSILVQTVSDFELILVDDGSPDHCGAICDEYAEKDSRIIVLHTANQGQAAARNRGLDLAKGDYISFVDADDYIHPRMLELVASIIKQTGIDIILFAHEVGNCADYGWSNEETDYRLFSSRDYLRESLLNGTGGVWILCDKIFKRKCFEGIRLPEGRIFEDNATVYKLMYTWFKYRNYCSRRAILS